MTQLFEVLPLLSGALIGLYAARTDRTFSTMLLCLIAGLTAHWLSGEAPQWLVADLLVVSAATVLVSRLLRYFLTQGS